MFEEQKAVVLQVVQKINQHGTTFTENLKSSDCPSKLQDCFFTYCSNIVQQLSSTGQEYLS
jgi:hypothetical protein